MGIPTAALAKDTLNCGTSSGRQKISYTKFIMVYLLN
jgi:hypothetical protein